MFGYIDESGAPGVANHNKDCLVVSLILFDSEINRDEAIAAIEKLRKNLRLPDDYEFHCSSNSTRPQVEFLKLLSSIKFQFITIAIHKDSFKRTASYMRLSRLIVDEIEKRFSKIKIEMDSNPIFYTELRKRIKERGLHHVRIHERNSRSCRLIQVADYVVNISAKKAKNTPKSHEWYRYIANKTLLFIEIKD